MSKRLETGAEFVEKQVISHFLVLQNSHPSQTPLRPEHFQHARHQAWWRAALSMREGWTPFDLGMSTDDVLELSGMEFSGLSQGQLDRIYARMVERWARWRVIEGLGRVYDDMKAGKIDIGEGVALARQSLAEAEAGSLSPVVTLQEAGVSLLDSYFAVVRDGTGRRPTIPMPLERLESKIGGWMRGTFWIVGACTSTHKTTLATLSAQHAAEQGFRALVWMLEDDQRTVAARVLARKIDWLDTRTLLMGDRKGKMGPIELEGLVIQAGAVLDADWARNLRIVSEKRPPLRRVTSIVAREAAKGVDLVVLDYLQLIRPDTRITDWTEHWNDVCHTLQALAADLDIAIVATAQPTQTAQREQFQAGRRITVSDLRGGAAISQSAYGIFLINAAGDEHKDENRRPVWTRDPNAVQITTAKNKAGPVVGGRFRVIPENDLITDEEP